MAPILIRELVSPVQFSAKLARHIRLSFRTEYGIHVAVHPRIDRTARSRIRGRDDPKPVFFELVAEELVEPGFVVFDPFLEQRFVIVGRQRDRVAGY